MKRTILSAVLATFLVTSASSASLVDDYKLISAESGISEFSADMSRVLDSLALQIFLLNVEQDIVGKIEHQPENELDRTYLKVSRSYVWLAKMAKRKGLENFTQAYALKAELYDDAAFGRDVTRSKSVMAQASKLIETQPSKDDKLSDVTPAERDEFAIMFSSGLWNVMDTRVDYDLAQPR